MVTLADLRFDAFCDREAWRVIAPVRQLRELEGGTLHWESFWRHPVRYEVFSELSPSADAHLPPISLPPVSLGRIRSLTDTIAGRGPALDQAKNIEAFLQKNYRYSTDFGDRPGQPGR